MTTPSHEKMVAKALEIRAEHDKARAYNDRDGMTWAAGKIHGMRLAAIMLDNLDLDYRLQKAWDEGVAP